MTLTVPLRLLSSFTRRSSTTLKWSASNRCCCTLESWKFPEPNFETLALTGERSMPTDSSYSAPGRLIDIGQSTTGGILPSAEGALSATNRLFVNGGDFKALIAALRQQRPDQVPG